jgi:Domain of unknown function (DUF6458)
MGIGASVFLLAIGAIITFAFNIRVGFIDLDIVGWILMAVGAFGLIMSLTMLNRRRTTVTTARPVVADPGMVAQQPVQYGSVTSEPVTRYDVDRPV